MKKVLVLALALSLVLGVATVLMASMTGPGIEDTPHDVRVITGDNNLEICAMCHTPHSGTGDYPLWNRDQAPQTYIMYASPTFDMAAVGSAQPQSPSSLCLVCHNGVFSELVNYPGPHSHVNEDYDFEMNAYFWAMLDTDLHNDHPISFTYDEVLDVDRNGVGGFPRKQPCPTSPLGNRMCIPAADAGPGGGTGFIGYPLYGTQHDQFECATCHSVHDTVKYSSKSLVGGKSVGTQVFFLRRDNSQSLMCGDCHVNRYGPTKGSSAYYGYSP